MNPRDSIAIAAAALRWSTAYDRRRTAGTAKRIADQANDDADQHGSPKQRHAAILAAGEASRCVTALKRQERAAMRALAKVRAKYRGALQEADVFDTVPALARLQVIDVQAAIVERA
ncbi:MAG: hypothetical protein WA159_17320 [Variovorax sp.]